MQMFSAGGAHMCDCVCVCVCVCERADPQSGVFEEAADTNTVMFVYAGR